MGTTPEYCCPLASSKRLHPRAETFHVSPERAASIKADDLPEQRISSPHGHRALRSTTGVWRHEYMRRVFAKLASSVRTARTPMSEESHTSRCLGSRSRRCHAVDVVNNHVPAAVRFLPPTSAPRGSSALALTELLRWRCVGHCVIDSRPELRGQATVDVVYTGLPQGSLGRASDFSGLRGWFW